MSRGFPSHLDLTVSDAARSVPFYAAVLERLGYVRARLPVGASALGMWYLAGGPGPFFGIALEPARGPHAGRDHDRYAPGLHHFAFHVGSREDVDGFHAFLLDLGVRILDPPAEFDYTPGYYAVFFADPDGLKLEVVHEPEPEFGLR